MQILRTATLASSSIAFLMCTPSCVDPSPRLECVKTLTVYIPERACLTPEQHLCTQASMRIHKTPADASESHLPMTLILAPVWNTTWHLKSRNSSSLACRSRSLDISSAIPTILFLLLPSISENTASQQTSHVMHANRSSNTRNLQSEIPRANLRRSYVSPLFRESRHSYPILRILIPVLPHRDIGPTDQDTHKRLCEINPATHDCRRRVKNAL